MRVEVGQKQGIGIHPSQDYGGFSNYAWPGFGGGYTASTLNSFRLLHTSARSNSLRNAPLNHSIYAFSVGSTSWIPAN
jgi:hypothetical protein